VALWTVGNAWYTRPERDVQRRAQPDRRERHHLPAALVVAPSRA
jgi:hypothetical protein